MIKDFGEKAVQDDGVKPVKCVWCEARLFDTNGVIAEPEALHAEIDIKCWRCKRVNVVYIVMRRG